MFKNIKKTNIFKHYYLFILFIKCLVINCSIIRDNPMDQYSENFIPPTVEVDLNNSSIAPNDTIHYDTGTIILSTNHPNCQIKYLLLDTIWTDWVPINKGILHFGGLEDGEYTLKLAVKYPRGSYVTEKEIDFHIQTNGYKPAFWPLNDTNIFVTKGMEVELYSTVSGVNPLHFVWKKNDKKLEQMIYDTLNIIVQGIQDTGFYYCIATNKYGEAKSRIYNLKICSPKSYKVSYYPNGADSGDTPVDESSYFSGDEIIIRGNIGNLVKSEYTFAGWCEMPDCQDTICKAGASLRIDTNDINLYAYWIANSMFKITYKDNGSTSGQAPVDSNLYKKDAKVVIKNSGTLVKTGYSFIEWNSDIKGNGEKFKPNSSLSIDTDVVLYAQWQLNDYTITFNSQKGSAVSPSTVEYGGLITSPEANREGYIFEGWYKDSSGKEKWDFETDTVVSDDTLYAKWVICDYKIEFNTQGGSAVSPLTIEYGGLIKSPETNREGYMFEGWYKDSSGKDKWDFKTDTVVSDDTLYAKWVICYYKIEFNTQNGSAISPLTVEYGGFITSPETNREGYMFEGWYKDSSGKNKWDFKIDTVVSDDTLYAKWVICYYKIEFNTQGGSAVSPLTVEYGSLITSPEANREGYIFEGWYKDSSGKDKWDFKIDTVVSNDTLYAKWAVIKCEVILNAHNGSEPEQRIINYGDITTVPIPQPTRQGYEFEGWYSNEEYTTEWNFDNKITSNLTIHGKWTIKNLPFEVATWSNFCKGVVTHTFDDGTVGQTSIAQPVFDEKDFNMTFFVVTGWNPDWNSLNDAFKNGHEIASHSVNHKSVMSDDECLLSQNEVKTKVPGEMCVTIAYPSCVIPEIQTDLKKYYIAGRVCDGEINSKSPENFYSISSIIAGAGAGINSASVFNAKAENAVDQNGWCVFLHHGVGSGDHSFSNTSVSELQNHINFLDGNRDRIWTESFGNVIRYIKERDAISINVISLTDKSITFQVKDNLPDSIFNYPLSIKREIPDDWVSIIVTQKNNIVPYTVFEKNLKNFVKFNVVPDGGDVLIKLNN